MYRLIAVFMLALLPFQFSWSAVAAYCMHESATTQAQHVGHHEHKHAANSVVGQADKNGQNTSQSDVDCWVCHGVGIGALHFAFAKQNISQDGDMGVQPNERVAEVTPSPPDRPQWPALA